MDNKEYENAVHAHSRRLGYLLSRNLAIAALGLSTSFSMLTYNVGTVLYLRDRAQTIPITIEDVNKIYIPSVKKVRNTQNAAIGIGGASGLYFILGLGIPLAGYAKKRKSLLEKQALQTNV